MRNRYLPYYVGKQTIEPYQKGAAHYFPIGDLGYKAQLTEGQLGDLVNHIKTGTPLQNKQSHNPAGLVNSLYSDEKIINYYNNVMKKVKRTPRNSGKIRRIKQAQPNFKLPYN